MGGGGRGWETVGGGERGSERTERGWEKVRWDGKR